LLLPRDLYEAMVAQAVAELPNECCGLLAGTLRPIDTAGPGPAVGRVVCCYPLVNKAASPREFLSDAHSLFAAHRDMRNRGLEVLAVYHSHPTSDPVPSRTDLERNYWPGVVSLIISLKGAAPVLRGWWLGAADYQQAEWECAE
jgi:proteasome lid subunit RPN8/RPN11